MTLEGGMVVLDRYQVEHLLTEDAEGEQSRIYLGEHIYLETPVFLKTLRAMQRGASLERFEREVRVHARINHPRVVRVIDYGVLDGGVPCLVMELAEGALLRDMLSSGRVLYWPEAVQLLLSLLEGLEAIHALGVAHRGVRPERVLWLGGESGNVRLLDFQIIGELSGDDPDPLGLGRSMGPLAYMAPEVLMGECSDAGADVYAAGLVCYEALTGGLPFGGGGPMALTRRITEEVPAPVVPEGRPAPPEELVVVLRRMLAREPGRRSVDCGTLRGALRRLLVLEAPSAISEVIEGGEVSEVHMHSSWSGSARPESLAGVLGSGLDMCSTVEDGAPALYAVIVARLPVSRLVDRRERVVLEGLLGEGHRGVRFGAQFWFGLIHTTTAEAARQHADVVARRLDARYADSGVICWAPLPTPLLLTHAHLSGVDPLPSVISELMDLCS